MSILGIVGRNFVVVMSSSKSTCTHCISFGLVFLLLGRALLRKSGRLLERGLRSEGHAEGLLPLPAVRHLDWSSETWTFREDVACVDFIC